MKKSKNTLLVTSCIFAMFGVAMGAIGKHWAEGFLLAKQLKTLSTATFYHQIYSILIFILSYIKYNQPSSFISFTTLSYFLVGMVIFSGSLYCYVFLNNKLFAMITPIGGILLMISWVLIIVDFFKQH